MGTKSRISWKGLFGISDSFTVCVFDISSSMQPSGALLATASVPITEPPGANGTMMRTGRVGSS